MGVNHLRRDAGMASSGKAAGNTGGSPHARQVGAGQQFARPAQNSGTRMVPKVGGVQSYSHQALKPGNSASQPPKGAGNGGRAGSKSGQPKIGKRVGYGGKPMSGQSMN